MKRITALISFLTGAVIYLLFRPKTLLGFFVLKSIGLGEWTDQLRFHFADCVLPGFVVYCLPNGLWSLSYVLLIDDVMDTTPKGKLLWASVIPIMGIVTELLQCIGWMKGTFDPMDLLCYGLPLVGYAIWIMIKSN